MTRKKKVTQRQAPGTEVQEKPQSEVAVSDLEAYAEVAGAGFEETHADDYAIPFITILQKGSPQVDEDDPMYVEGAKPGMFLNTVTGEVYEGKERGLTVIPTYFKKEYLEWVPREQGGGLVAIHPYSKGVEMETERDDNGRFVLPNGNNLVDTAKHYVLVVDPKTQDVFPAIISMTSTQLKKSRKWNYIMGGKKLKMNGKTFKAPSFAFTYQMTTLPESNDKGSWHGWMVTPGDMANAYRYEALDFYKAVAAGEVKEQDPQQDVYEATPETSDAF